jgi:dienelactone hydrolase
MSGPRKHPRRRIWGRRFLVTLALISTALLATISAYLGYVSIQHRQPVTLPAPEGGYAIGRTTVDWTDANRTDPLAPRPGIARELSAWLWYPATVGARSSTAPYAPGLWSHLHLGSPVGLGQSRFDVIRTHAVQDAPVATGRFPVVVLTPGLGLAGPQYSTLAENLASHGYLVAALTPTYSANVSVLRGRVIGPTPAGNPPAFETEDLHHGEAVDAADRLVAVLAADVRSTADRILALESQTRFSGHVDQAHVVYAGHSLGGAASLEGCRTDPRCAGAVDLDGTQFGPVTRTGLDKPLMIWAGDGSCVTGTCTPTTAGDRADRDTARAMIAAGDGPNWCYRLRGGQHFTFTDYSVYYLAAPLRALIPVGSIDGARALSIVGDYLTAFTNHVLRGSVEPLLSDGPAPYQQVQTLRRPT